MSCGLKLIAETPYLKHFIEMTDDATVMVCCQALAALLGSLAAKKIGVLPVNIIGCFLSRLTFLVRVEVLRGEFYPKRLVHKYSDECILTFTVIALILSQKEARGVIMVPCLPCKPLLCISLSMVLAHSRAMNVS